MKSKYSIIIICLQNTDTVKLLSKLLLLLLSKLLRWLLFCLSIKKHIVLIFHIHASEIGVSLRPIYAKLVRPSSYITQPMYWFVSFTKTSEVSFDFDNSMDDWIQFVVRCT